MSLMGYGRREPAWAHSVCAEDTFVSHWLAGWIGQTWRLHFRLEDTLGLDWLCVTNDALWDVYGARTSELGQDDSCIDEQASSEYTERTSHAQVCWDSGGTPQARQVMLRSCLKSNMHGRKPHRHVQFWTCVTGAVPNNFVQTTSLDERCGGVVAATDTSSWQPQSDTSVADLDAPGCCYEGPSDIEGRRFGADFAAGLDRLDCEYAARSEEVLPPRWQEEDVAEQCHAREAPVILQLDELIPCAGVRETLVSFEDLPMELDTLAEHFRLEAMRQDLEHLGSIHTATKDALSRMLTWNKTFTVSTLRLYVDGSFETCSGRAGWAVVGIGVVDSTWQFLGYFADQLYARSHMKWLGNDGNSAHVAELAATTCALVMIGFGSCSTCEIVYDATSAAGVAAGMFDCPALAALSQAATSVAVRAWRRGVWLGFRHVRGHTGDPFNELADVVAKASFRMPDFAAAPLGNSLAMIVLGQVRDWLWFVACQHGTDIALPCLDLQNFQPCFRSEPLPPILTAHVSEGQVPGVPACVLEDVTSSCGETPWTLKAVTYNALTLQSEARRQALDGMFAKDGVHCVGIQESRETIEGPRHLENYVCLGSPADKGQLGCQLWLNKAASVAVSVDGNQLKLEHKKAVVVMSQPRLLCVTVPVGGSLLGLIVGHAPTNQATEECRQTWWNSLGCVMRSLPRKVIPVLLLDANSRFEIRERLATARCCEPIGPNAEHFVGFLREHELSTQQLRDEEGHDLVTWRSPAGGDSCIDYVVFPCALDACALTVGIPPSFCDLLGHDHFLVLLELRWCQGAVCRRQTCRIDTEKMRTAAGQATLRDIFCSSPVVPWEHHVDDHLHIVNEHVWAGLVANFPKSPARPRKPHISGQQWDAIRQRRHARRVCFRIKQQLARDLTAWCFGAWKDGVSGHTHYDHQETRVQGFS